MSKIILKEEDLHNIIKESILNILKEGQGFEFFKRSLNDKDYLNNFNKDELNNFINTGDQRGKIKGYENNFYEVDEPSYSHNDFSTMVSPGRVERVNKSKLGKLGRKTGVEASKIINKLKGGK